MRLVRSALMVTGFAFHLSVFAAGGDLGQLVEVIPLEGTKEAVISTNMRGGYLNLSGGSDQLVSARLAYKGGAMPQFLVNREGTTTKVSFEGLSRRDNWILLVNDQIPTSLQVASREGNQRILLQGIKLRSLTTDTGKSATFIEGTGDFPLFKSLHVQQDAGSLALHLPGSYSALSQFQVSVKKSAVSASLSGSYQALQTADFETASGPLALRLSGDFPVLTTLNTQTSSGHIALDLQGKWGKNAVLNVKTQSGGARLMLPKDIGVKVHVSPGAGRVTARGLQEPNGEETSGKEKPRRMQRRTGNERIFVNSAYGKSSITLTVYVSTVSGTIELEGVPPS